MVKAKAESTVQSATTKTTSNSPSSILRQSPVEITSLPLTPSISPESHSPATDSSSHITTSHTISTTHTTSSTTSSLLRSTSDPASSSYHVDSTAASSLVEVAFNLTSSHTLLVLQTTSSLPTFQTTPTGGLQAAEITSNSLATSSLAQPEEETFGVSSILPQSFTVVQVITSGSVHTLATVTLSGPGSVTRSTSTVSVAATPGVHSTTHPSLLIPIAISVGGFVCLFCILLLIICLRYRGRSQQTDVEPLVTAEAEDSQESRGRVSDGVSISEQVIDIFEAPNIHYSGYISSTGEIQSLRQQLDQLNNRVEQISFRGAHNSISVEHRDNRVGNGGRTDTVQLSDPDPDPDATPPPTYRAGHISLTDTLSPDENEVTPVDLHITPYPMEEEKNGREHPF